MAKKDEIVAALKECAVAKGGKFAVAARELFGVLGYQSKRSYDAVYEAGDFIRKGDGQNVAHRAKYFSQSIKTIFGLFQYAEDDIAEKYRSGDKDSVKKSENKSFLFVAAEVKRKGAHARGDYAQWTREINSRYVMPVVVLFRSFDDNGKARLTFAFAGKRRHKIIPHLRVLEAVSLLLEIEAESPHRGHLDILEEMSAENRFRWIDDEKGSERNFDGMRDAWLHELNSEGLNDRFYEEIQKWFERAVESVRFPKEMEKKQHVIRLINRVLFIWFLKEKGLVADQLFEEKIGDCLKERLPSNGRNYYCAVLQNLFFGTLNAEIDKRDFRDSSQLRKWKNPEYKVFSLYRYEKLISDKEKLKNYFKQTPFVNGGLFDCLDDFDSPAKGGKLVDCFTDNNFDEESPVCRKMLLHVPNFLFFDKSNDNPGLFNILRQYKFTVQENTPNEQEVALDPELLGMVYERLLAFVNRREKGVYYTPRRIVDYMAREALVAHFATKMPKAKNLKERLRHLLTAEIDYDILQSDEKLHNDETEPFIDVAKEMRLLDPAAGSGAFLMGVLNQLAMALDRIDPKNKILRKREELWARASDDDNHRKEALEMVEKTFSQKNAYNNYGRKLMLVRECLFGVDVLPAAVQICRLRFFISLAIEQKKNENRSENYGIQPLPNLEARIVAADTLHKIGEKTMFSEKEEVKAMREDLQEIRRQFFSANTRSKKQNFMEQDKKKRREMANYLRNSVIAHAKKRVRMEKSKGRGSEKISKKSNISDPLTLIADRIAAWNLYDSKTAADWFDAKWMFGVQGGFDIVVGNPPYSRVENLSPSYRKKLEDTFGRPKDLYEHFIDIGLKLTKEGGIFSYITNDSFIRFSTKKETREKMLEWSVREIIRCPEETFKATIYTAVFMIAKEKGDHKQEYATGDFVYPDYFRHELGKVSYAIVKKHTGKRFFIADPLYPLYERFARDEKFGKVSNHLAVFDTGIHSGNVRHKIFFAKKEKEGLSRLLQGRQIDRYTLDWQNKTAQYRWCDPNYQCQNVLGIGRRERHSRHKEYWHFCGEKENHHQPERLLVRQTADKIVAAYHGAKESGHFYTDNTLFTVLPKRANAVNLKYALAVFNGALLNTIYAFLVQEHGRVLPQVKISVLDELPFACPPLQKQAEIASLAEAVTAEISQELPKQKLIGDLLNEIDNRLYEVYQLTANEIALVEEWKQFIEEEKSTKLRKKKEPNTRKLF